MKSDRQRPKIASPDPKLEVIVTDDGSRTLADRQDQQRFHSESGALAEAHRVYLENSGVAQRLAESLPTKVLEIGFGTGLNFLISASKAMKESTDLAYVGVDRRLVRPPVFQALQLNELSECQPACDIWEPLWHAENDFGSSRYDFRWSSVDLRLFQIDALTIQADELPTFDAIYFDPFSPEANPELWETSFLRTLRACLNDGGKLVTYCVKSEIQKRMKSAGFTVSKTRGPIGGKREVMVATRGDV